jgi:hypothetical protein
VINVRSLINMSYDTSQTDLAVFQLTGKPWEQAVVLDDQDSENLKQEDLAPFYEKLYADTGCNFNDGRWSLVLLGGPNITEEVIYEE